MAIRQRVKRHVLSGALHPPPDQDAAGKIRFFDDESVYPISVMEILKTPRPITIIPAERLHLMDIQNLPSSRVNMVRRKGTG